MGSLSEVARRAGVSKATASRALSGAGYVSDTTRARVVEAAADLGYVASSAAASLVTGSTRNVGVVTPYISRWFFAEVLEGVEGALIEAGYDLTLYRIGDDATQRRRVFDYFLMRKRVDAVIAIGVALSREEVDLLHLLGKPVVGIGGDVPGIPTMRIDDVAVTRLVTEHLLSLGHRRIVHLGGEQDEQMDFRVHGKRLEGFRAALAAAGVPTGDAADDFVATPFSVAGGYHAAIHLLADPRTRPSAIVAGCDEIAIGAITAARQLGIQVPAQLSVVGIDDHELAEIFGLTTVRQSPREQGAAAVEAILGPLGGGRPLDARPRLIPTSLRVRTSTTAPAAE
ncbi:LacI family DNA-binding transcriptional regulator [Homoserinibacter sp. YIM 151385]|uniref:LacI family DNA-binding transcriptional regulator n=1 Tax=Homoserinibacter sp. YIM 151385 TaxID=2985506 RepID=UPI0022F0C3DD|nr:LacI family DNA-binding transcriptional regulator [Homoserinibacter sp. YIM 151385]WBU36928.1 LacI family DNA-binding transcriptional regulator [Homoserinibacter sp. YIM 151385]